MSENKNPIEAITNVTKSLATPSFFNSDSAYAKPFIPELEDLTDLELRTLEDDPAFTELLTSFKEEVEQSRKSSTRTFIVALLSLIVGCISLGWTIAITFL